MTNTIFLIGYMGVGKSSLGKKLANKLNLPFLDTDELLEQKFGFSIADYFVKNGEQAFRLEEKDLLEQNDFNNTIVATGGGLPCFYDNMEVMNEKGITIFLNRPAKELYQRLVNAKKQRPLIKELKEDDLLDFITNQLNDRLPYYEKATFILDRKNQSVEEIIARISNRE
jgi:shikimate kinase